MDKLFHFIIYLKIMGYCINFIYFYLYYVIIYNYYIYTSIYENFIVPMIRLIYYMPHDSARIRFLKRNSSL